MGIHRPKAVGTDPQGVTSPVGSVWTLLDLGGKVYNAGYSDEDKNYPAQLGGGENHDLGVLHESAVDGWNATTGVVVQTATGLSGVCDVTNPTVIIDLPVYGSMMPASFAATCTVSCAAPGAGEVGCYITSNKDGTDIFYRMSYSTGAWRAEITDAGGTTTSAQTGVAPGDIGDVHSVGFLDVAESTTIRSMMMMISEPDVMAPLDNVKRVLGTARETITDPYTTYDLRLKVEWVSGDPIVFEFHTASLKVESMAFTLPAKVATDMVEFAAFNGAMAIHNFAQDAEYRDASLSYTKGTNVAIEPSTTVQGCEGKLVVSPASQTASESLYVVSDAAQTDIYGCDADRTILTIVRSNAVLAASNELALRATGSTTPHIVTWHGFSPAAGTHGNRVWAAGAWNDITLTGVVLDDVVIHMTTYRSSTREIIGYVKGTGQAAVSTSATRTVTTEELASTNHPSLGGLTGVWSCSDDLVHYSVYPRVLTTTHLAEIAALVGAT